MKFTLEQTKEKFTELYGDLPGVLEEAEKFWYYNEARDWMMGKSRIKSLGHAVGYWMRKKQEIVANWKKLIEEKKNATKEYFDGKRKEEHRQRVSTYVNTENDYGMIDYEAAKKRLRNENKTRRGRAGFGDDDYKAYFKQWAKSRGQADPFGESQDDKEGTDVSD
jgi:hypothetical protein